MQEAQDQGVTFGGVGVGRSGTWGAGEREQGRRVAVWRWSGVEVVRFGGEKGDNHPKCVKKTRTACARENTADFPTWPFVPYKGT